MVRFEPDTWTDALLRFFAMADPNANVYVEIAAPDLRFAAMVLLAIAVAVSWRRLAGSPRPAAALFVLLLAAAVAWIATSGNGRYFIPMLLCVGPLVAALVYLLPLSRFLRLSLAGGLLAAQAFVVFSSFPWNAWSWMDWQQAPYFQVVVPRSDPSAAPTTYVTLTGISYSLIAPQFPADSRWLNTTTIGAVPGDGELAQEFLGAAKGPLKLLVPTIPGQSNADGSPLPELRKALDILLGPQRLALDESRPCDLLPSDGMAAIQGRRGAAQTEHIGFWVCSLRYPVTPAPTEVPAIAANTEAAFARIEQECPRFFQPGSAKSLPLPDGVVRHYAASGMKLYALDNGTVMYKYWRALNAVSVGKLADVLEGRAKIDCEHIRGRAGLPWEREI